MTGRAPTVEAWVAALRERHTQTVTFQEIRKGVVALSRIYVHERKRIGTNIFDGAGKRAAFACFYAPIHYLLVEHIVIELGAHGPRPSRIIDLGCGSLSAGAAWCRASGGAAPILGVDQSSWAVAEAQSSMRELGLRARVVQKRIERAPLAKPGEAVVSAFAVNELDEPARSALLARLMGSIRRGVSVLVVEPIARRSLPWWDEWSHAFDAAGGRSDEWRFAAELPELIRELDRAAGLDHSELTGRSLFSRGLS